MSERPRVIKRRRTKGWRMPAGAVYVGRPTIYSNPFRTASEFRWWWETRGQGPVLFPEQMDMLMGAMFQTEPHPLRGKHLVCWCVDWDGTGEPPGVCHAEVLLELANPDLFNLAEIGGPKR